MNSMISGCAETYDPKDGASGIDKEPSVGFLLRGKVVLGKKVANGFGASHTEGCYAVGVPPPAKCEWE